MRAPGHIRGRVYSPAAWRILTDRWLHFRQGQRKNDVNFQSYPLSSSGSETCRTVASARSSARMRSVSVRSRAKASADPVRSGWEHVPMSDTHTFYLCTVLPGSVLDCGASRRGEARSRVWLLPCRLYCWERKRFRLRIIIGSTIDFKPLILRLIAVILAAVLTRCCTFS